MAGLPRPAQAGTSAALELKKAQTYVDLGTDLFVAGDYRGALAEFERAAPLVADTKSVASVRYNIARCLEELGRTRQAIAAFDAYLALPDPDRRARRKTRHKLEALERAVYGRLQVRCRPAGGQVVLERGAGERSEPRDCPATFRRLEAGTYRVVGSRGTQERAQEGAREVELRVGQTARIVLELSTPLEVSPVASAPPPPPATELAPPPAPDLAPPPAPDLVPPPAPAPLGRSPSYLGWGLLGGAAIAAGAGAWFYQSAASDIRRLDAKAKGYSEATDPAAITPLRRAVVAAEGDAILHRSLAYGLLALGVGLGGAATWVLWPAEASGPGRHAVLHLSPGGVSLAGSF